MSDSKVTVARDGMVTVTFDVGKVEEVEVEAKTKRFFHNATDREQQVRGFGYRTKKDAADALANIAVAALIGLGAKYGQMEITGGPDETAD